MVRRLAGEFDNNIRPNAIFRKLVLNRLMEELDVTLASAATMYNTLKKEGDVAAGRTGKTLGLGRDRVVNKPTKEKKEQAKTKEAIPKGNLTDNVLVDDANSKEEAVA
jgi:hypothetical protein